MQAKSNNVRVLLLNKHTKLIQPEDGKLLKSLSQGDRTAFWLLWKRYQTYLYHRCLTWMGGNSTDAQEALSQATLKAWDKLPIYAEKINNPKAWLTRMTHNLCVDMHRKRNRGARGIESIEDVAGGEDNTVTSNFESPESAVLRRELELYTRRAVNTLSPKLRNPFILRFYQEMSYPDIAAQLGLSLDNVYKRIQKAREILQKRLNKYLSGVDDSPSLLREGVGEPIIAESQFETSVPSNAQVPMTTECNVEQINYEVTLICLEQLPHVWYNRPSLQGWS
jgi:RNA polymerase sigma-70 factor (ECF subfamily)